MFGSRPSSSMRLTRLLTSVSLDFHRGWSSWQTLFVEDWSRWFNSAYGVDSSMASPLTSQIPR